jgi:type VI secretion system secreted protein VgrG
MALLELSFASKEDSLSVRRFAVREAMSSLYEISVVARSPNEDLDLEAIVGQPASLSIAAGLAHAPHGARRWGGVCNFMEQEQAEETGLSTYHLRIVPTLWLLTQRRNHRIFQHLSAPEIAGKMLEEWGIEAEWYVHRAHHPRLEYRVQYGESDFAFISRILEEAGISYHFADHRERGSVLHLLDAPHAAEARAGGPIPSVDHPNQAAEREFVTKVKISHEVRPGKVTIRAYDFRRKTDYELIGHATAARSPEERLEQFHYQHGAFVIEGHKEGNTPAADDRGVARADEKIGTARAEKHLAAERASKRRVSFHTNAFDLRPGVVFSIGHHARSDLGEGKELLVTDLSIEGTHDQEWTASGHAVFAAHPYHPPKRTEKPHVHGVQSAVVVGPNGQEIYTDEFGRVRVLFHWDRERTHEGGTSCWMRVSQGWGGGGFGMLALPRVGQEVLIGFFEGDPDQPIVVGRVFNNTTRVPYKLPEHKTRSTWKSDSSPGSDGFNEIMFEDAKGHELVYVQAERNLDRLVKHDETITVGKNRATTVGEVDEAAIGVREVSHIKGTPTGREMVAGRISLTTGEATITLEGPNITMQAAANILLNAGASILANAGAEITINAGANVTINAGANVTVASGAMATVSAGGGDLVLQGGPMVKIATGGVGSAGASTGPSTIAFGDMRLVVPPGVDIKANLHRAKKHRRYHPKHAHWFAEMTKPGAEWDFHKHGSQYEAFHHFHFGMIGRCMGLPKGALIRHAKKQSEGENMAYAGELTSHGCDFFDRVERHILPFPYPHDFVAHETNGDEHGTP